VASRDCECFLPNIIIRDQIIRTIEIALFDLIAWHELVDFNGVIALKGNRVQFFIFDRNVAFFEYSLPRSLSWPLEAYFRVEELLRELANPNLHDIPTNLPFRVDMWERSNQHVRWVVAACSSAAVGHAAFDSAIRNYPGQRFHARFLKTIGDLVEVAAMSIGTSLDLVTILPAAPG
jgi:hypothetical protein